MSSSSVSAAPGSAAPGTAAPVPGAPGSAAPGSAVSVSAVPSAPAAVDTSTTLDAATKAKVVKVQEQRLVTGKSNVKALPTGNGARSLR